MSQFNDELARKGLKATKRRVEILDILEKSEQPLSAEQIFMQMKEHGESANLSTVYRTLETLTDAELALKVNIPGDSRSFFEFKGSSHHHHLICLGCSKVLALNDCPLGNYEQSLAQKTNFAISGHMLDIYGYCPECRDKPGNEATHDHNH